MGKLRKFIKIYTIFFIVAFTLGILAASIGNSAIINKRKAFDRNDIDKNKSIVFEQAKNFDLKDILSILEKYKISTSLTYNNLEEMYSVKTIVYFDGLNLNDDMVSGKFFTESEFKNSDENKGIFSSTLTKENKFNMKYHDRGEIKEATLERQGKTFQSNNEVIIPQKLFYKIIKSKELDSGEYFITIHGDKKELDKAIEEITSFIKSKNSSNSANIKSYVMTTNDDDAMFLYNISFLILIIIVINSISISYLWVTDNKKELVLRKVCGARDRDLFKMFFSELMIISMISVVFAIIIQSLMVILTNGILGTIDIRLSFNNIIYSAIISIITAFLAALPINSQLKKLEIVEMLKEE